MSTTFTDVYGAVLLGLQTIIGGEFEEPVYVSDEYEHDGFRLNPTGTEHIQGLNPGETRTYEVEIFYYVDAPKGKYRVDHLLDRYSRLNRVIQNNDEYRVDSVQKWFNGKIGICVVGPVDEEKPRLGQFKGTFTCSYTETFS